MRTAPADARQARVWMVRWCEKSGRLRAVQAHLRWSRASVFQFDRHIIIPHRVGGNTTPGVVASESCALAVGDAEQAAIPSKAAGHRRQMPERLAESLNP